MTENKAFWHEDAIRDLQETTLSAAEIGAKYGRSAKAVEKLIYTKKIVRNMPTTRRGPRPRTQRAPLSKNHHRIGMKLTIARGEDKVRAFAAKLGISDYVLMQMENGLHDFRMSEIERIETLIGLSYAELKAGFENKIYQKQQRSRHGPG